ncbi:hypothetical protein BDZ45DRAFT_294303 [Acephala macrosclerotiorum]|nr:hypothetical protein BDZ45DRAFT_294303 [Acephala macrosclerotiorum]
MYVPGVSGCCLIWWCLLRYSQILRPVAGHLRTRCLPLPVIRRIRPWHSLHLPLHSNHHHYHRPLHYDFHPWCHRHPCPHLHSPTHILTQQKPRHKQRPHSKI